MCYEKSNRLAINLVLALIAYFLTCIALEVFFRNFVYQSDSYSFTLASMKWFERYWHSLNSSGDRDSEHSILKQDDKKIIWVVGDSIAAGHGIKNHEDRFSELLGEKLGEDWLIINIAKPGWDTKNEWEAMISNPFRPHTNIYIQQ